MSRDRCRSWRARAAGYAIWTSDPHIRVREHPVSRATAAYRARRAAEVTTLGAIWVDRVPSAAQPVGVGRGPADVQAPGDAVGVPPRARTLAAVNLRSGRV